MNHTILIRYGELALKGNNREYFEKKLVDNIKKAIKTIEITSLMIERERGRIILKLNHDKKNNEAREQIIKILSSISGISSFSFAYECEYDQEDEKNFENLTKCFDENLLSSIKEKIKHAEKSKKQLKFRATASRLVKTGINSRELQQEFGSHIWTMTEGNLKVDLKNFDFQIEAEIIKKAYVFSSYDHYIGKAGLPLGTQGTVLALFFPDELEKCAKSAIELMRRGTIPIMIALKDSEESEKFQKAVNDISINAPGFEIKAIFADTDIIKFANEFAETRDIRTISVPDTIENIKTYETSLLVLRPLIIDREMIKQEMFVSEYTLTQDENIH